MRFPTHRRPWRVAPELPLLAGALALALALALMAGFGVTEGAQGSWSQLDLDDIRVDVVAVDPNDPNFLFAGTNGQGIFRSTNGGQSWAQVNTGLGNLFVNDILISPTNTNNLLAGVGRGPAVGEPNAGVYRSTDRGATWTRVLEAATIFSLALTPQNPSVVYAGGGPPVFKSTDGGVTWQPAFQPGTDIVNVDIRGISVNPTDPSIVLAGGNTEGGQGQLFRSANAGMTWDRVLAGQAAILDVRFAVDLRLGPYALFGNLVGTFRSSDTGLTWQRVTEELGDIEVRATDPDPLDASDVAIATNRGVFRSTDGGFGWSLLDTSLGSQDVRDVTFNRADPQTLYAGTADGAWAFTFVAPLPATPTPPVPTPGPTAVSWFFAEGSTQPPFDTWFLVQNTTSSRASVRFTFRLENGTNVVRDFAVAPSSRFSIFVNQIMPNVAFSTRVDSDQQVFVERSMFAGFGGATITGIPSPARLWLFAEGATVQPFDTWVLIQNPNDVPASTTITYLLPDRPPVVQSLGALPPTSRTSVFVNQVLPNAEFGVRVDSDQPVIVERSMFRFPGNAAATTAGANNSSRDWFFAEGSSLQQQPGPADTFLLLENPQQATATVTITLFGLQGQQNRLQIAMPGNSRRTIFLNEFFPNSSFGIRVQSTEQIVAERSQFFGPEPRGFTGSLGGSALANEWNFAEGSTQPPFTTVIAVLNPNDQAMNVRMDFLLENGQVVSRDFTVGATRKLSVNVNDILPNVAFSTKVTTSLPSVAERTMFFTKMGSVGVSNVVGISR